MRENGINMVVLSGSRESGRSRRILRSHLHGFATGFEDPVGPRARGAAPRLDCARG